MDTEASVAVLFAQGEVPAQRAGSWYVCCVVCDGLAVSASLHKTEAEAVEEAGRCGQEYFRDQTDDIVVFELDSDGSCVDKVYDFRADIESGPEP